MWPNSWSFSPSRAHAVEYVSLTNADFAVAVFAVGMSVLTDKRLAMPKMR